MALDSDIFLCIFNTNQAKEHVKKQSGLVSPSSVFDSLQQLNWLDYIYSKSVYYLLFHAHLHFPLIIQGHLAPLHRCSLTSQFPPGRLTVAQCHLDNLCPSDFMSDVPSSKKPYLNPIDRYSTILELSPLHWFELISVSLGMGLMTCLPLSFSWLLH